jgi:hypothetical protein
MFNVKSNKMFLLEKANNKLLQSKEIYFIIDWKENTKIIIEILPILLCKVTVNMRNVNLL